MPPLSEGSVNLSLYRLWKSNLWQCCQPPIQILPPWLPIRNSTVRVEMPTCVKLNFSWAQILYTVYFFKIYFETCFLYSIYCTFITMNKALPVLYLGVMPRILVCPCYASLTTNFPILESGRNRYECVIISSFCYFSVHNKAHSY
jgi:hypothetical protein